MRVTANVVALIFLVVLGRALWKGNMAFKEPSTKAKILSYLATREYTRVELEAKVMKWLRQKAQQKIKQKEQWRADWDARPGNTDDSEDLDGCHVWDEQQALEEVRSVLDEFEQKGWVSDERFVESLLNQKGQRFGNQRLKQELNQKGVNEALVQDALEEMKGTEFERACEVWARKFKVLPVDAKEYGKQMRFLVYRGFAAEIARKVLQGGWGEDEV